MKNYQLDKDAVVHFFVWLTLSQEGRGLLHPPLSDFPSHRTEVQNYVHLFDSCKTISLDKLTSGSDEAVCYHSNFIMAVLPDITEQESWNHYSAI